jgi:hypothetical protein
MSDVMTLGTWSNYETRLANMWLIHRNCMCCSWCSRCLAIY